MPDAFRLLLAILACYRLAMLITKDEITRPIRTYFGLHRWAWVRSFLGELTHCPYCVGVWIAAGLALLLWPLNWLTLLYWLAIAGGQATLQTFSDLAEAE